ncbi:MAG: carbamoyltransferase HypF [Methanomassiliicoccales archaeon]|nr:MAG: carbamoyltransferase HypF [Methanomassiliicoccales archaeon]
MRIVFYGLVQGVGFRPAVYRVAKSLGLKGFIRNNGSNVEVVIDKDQEDFLAKLKAELPPLARITRTEFEDIPSGEEYKDFSIILSEDGERSSVIPADTAICDGCQKELFDEDNRRYHFPFINCTDCGARFSAIASVPYDRKNTSMKAFLLCEKCQDEYDSPSDRRFYAQTISCVDDGPHFTVYGKDGEEISTDNKIRFFADRIDDGAIGVLKSWGGMHLICNLEVLKRFRKWYSRPEKPFAVMARNIKAAKELASISPFDEKLLTSLQRPIVIVMKKQNRLEDHLLDLVSPGLDNIGLYLPYSAIQHLLFSYLKNDAIIMTSANPPGEPIIIDNDGVFKMGADIYLLHNRQVINRIDDSVIVPFEGSTYFIRKSRGYVPIALNPHHEKRVIGVGAEENVTASVSTGSKIYLTQYIGDVRDYNVYEFHRQATFHLLELFGIKEVEAIGADLHPLYTSKRFASELSKKYQAEIFQIQHHWAHAASLMVDREISEPMVCLTLDGAGYGSDGTIWGGEVLLSSFTEFERIARLEHIPLIGGDKAAEDPKRILFGISEMLGMQSSYFDDSTASILKKAMNNSPMSSSFGRFLDAISCYLGICCKKTYDGEPAIKLERYLNRGEKSYDFHTKIEGSDVKVIKTLPLFKELFEYSGSKTLSEKEKCDLAYSMVSEALERMVQVASECASEKEIPYIGLSGGVAYDLPIVRIVKEAVAKRGLTLITHNHVPCGDGGISVGQNAIAGNILEQK